MIPQDQGGKVNRNQVIVVALAAASLALILVFPPFDQYSIASSAVPIFAGFYFFFAPPPWGEVNAGVLMLEAFVVLVNGAIGWLLLQRKPVRGDRRLGYQKALLAFAGINLFVVVLFPPFESVFALTNAALPTFEGFYPIFNRQPNHTIVITLLQIEIIFILVNAAIAWLIFRQRRQPALTAREVQAVAQELRRGKI
jgi:hypothetical protein